MTKQPKYAVKVVDLEAQNRQWEADIIRCKVSQKMLEDNWDEIKQEFLDNYEEEKWAMMGFWLRISSHILLDNDFIIKHKDSLRWDKLFISHNFDEDFIRKYFTFSEGDEYKVMDKVLFCYKKMKLCFSYFENYLDIADMDKFENYKDVLDSFIEYAATFTNSRYNSEWIDIYLFLFYQNSFCRTYYEKESKEKTKEKTKEDTNKEDDKEVKSN